LFSVVFDHREELATDPFEGDRDVVSMLTCNDPTDTRKHDQPSAHL
jgi:hypothetical protein